MNRRACDVKIPPLLIGANQAVEIARLELMGVLCQSFQIADSIVAGAGFEEVTESQRAKGCVTSGAASSDGNSVPVYVSTLDKIPCAIHAIVDIDDTPSILEPLSVCAAVTGTATVIHVEYGNTSTGPILNRVLEGRGTGRSRPAVAHDDQRRLFIRRRRVIPISRRIEVAVGGKPALGGELHGLRMSEVSRI